MRFFLALVVVVIMLTGCEEKPIDAKMKKPAYKQQSFSDLKGWETDQHKEAMTVFIKSCPRLAKNGAPKLEQSFQLSTRFFDWAHLCEQAKKTAVEKNPLTARQFFEQEFIPYAVEDRAGAEGLFTGYFEIVLQGAREQSEVFPIPVLARPDDLVGINLKDFPGIPEDAQHITLFGRVEKNQMKLYPGRDQIQSGLLADKGLELAWLKNKIDLLYLQIQGSGIIQFDDGSQMRVGYAAKNGHPYQSVGKELVRRGDLLLEEASMAGIRQWFEAHPEDGDSVIAVNPSYIFFRTIEGEGPIGAAGVALTPERSLAVDLAYYDLGLPLWLEAQGPRQTSDIRRLMVAQDTGSAITGIVRGDFFWGTGSDAGQMAGAMKSAGRYYLFVPKAYQLKP